MAGHIKWITVSLFKKGCHEVIVHQESVVWWLLKQIIALIYCLVVSQRNHVIVLYAQMPNCQTMFIELCIY